jgi:hypothetical protein
MPRRIGAASLYLFLAYWILTATGIALTIVFGWGGYWGRRLRAAIFASPTVGERFFLGPSALLLAFLCFAATRADFTRVQVLPAEQGGPRED